MSKTEETQVCNPVECAGALFQVLYLLQLIARPGMNTSIAATNTLRPNLPAKGSLVPLPRVLSGRGVPPQRPVPPIPVLPHGWVGTPLQFGGNWYASAAEAAIHALQIVLAVLPDSAKAADDPAWRDFPWERVLKSEPCLIVFRAGSLDDLTDQAEELLAAVKGEYLSYAKERAAGAGDGNASRKPKAKRHYTQKPLTKPQFAAMDAYVRCGQNVGAVAAELGISRSAAYNRLQAALKKTGQKPLSTRAAKSVRAHAMPTDKRGQISI